MRNTTGSSVGKTIIVDGIEYEVLWDGGEGLTAPRETKPTGFWTPPKRLYNKKSEFWKQDRTKGAKPVDKPAELGPDSDPNYERDETCPCDLGEPERCVDMGGDNDTVLWDDTKDDNL